MKDQCMNKLWLAVLALPSTLIVFQAEAAQYAGSIIACDSGKLPAAVVSFTNAAQARVSVSADNEKYYVLNPAQAPTVDGGFPTDGTGDFTGPVDPARRSPDFAGQNLDGIRARYEGGAGGNGYDIGWAQDDQGRSVALNEVRYVRVEVQKGHAEIDGFAVAAGAPGPAAVTYQENFDRDPLGKGWRAFGDASLFQWNVTNQNLEITWDSSRSNSYFWLPLNTVLAKDDDFTLQFDLQLNDVAVGTTPGKPFTFEIALGLLNHGQATATNFWRGTGTQSPDLVEFDYFPDSGYGATVWPAFVDTNGIFSYNGSDDYTIAALPLGAWLRVNMSYSASNQTMVTKITRDGQALTDINPITLSAGFGDFRVDAFALSSYSDTGSSGSVLAHGKVDNLAITVPAPPLSSWAGGWTNGGWRMEGIGRSNWVYRLERTADFRAWTGVATAGVASDNRLTLMDSNPPPVAAFYRIRADRP